MSEFHFWLKKKTVEAKIISWIRLPQGSFPIFQFVTESGEEITGVTSQKDILPLEAMPIKGSTMERFKKTLPIEHAKVTYEVNKPYIFTGFYAPEY